MAANSPSHSPRLGLILALAALQAVCTISGAPAAEQGDTRSQAERSWQPAPIGIARMEADGTIVLELFRTGDGQSGDAIFHYPKSDPGYQKILDHVGPLNPDGISVLVSPWPDEGTVR
jgi:hypothetical protein